MRLKFHAPAHHVLIEAGERIMGGGEFEVDAKRGRELLVSRVSVSKIKSPSPPKNDEPVSDGAVTDAEAHLLPVVSDAEADASSTPTDE